jgi:PLP dependent protein
MEKNNADFINYRHIVNAVGDILIVAVSKYQSDEAVQQMMDCGQLHFGENKVQDLLRRQLLWPQCHWHLIGHLQTNKVKAIIGKTTLIHSLDSIKLADLIAYYSKLNNVITDCLIQVNLTTETNKTGVRYDDWKALFHYCMKLEGIRIKGLMVIGPNTDQQEAIKTVFEQAYQIYQTMKLESDQVCYLSMGMSGDYELALACGSNLLRLGSVLFERGITNV